MKRRLVAAIAAAMVLGSSLTAAAAPQTMKDGTVFDADYYAQQNPDVVAVFGTDTKALYRHYVNHGKSEGRKSHVNDAAHRTVAADPTFDPTYYAQQNPDVVAVYGTDPNSLYRHYVDHGKSEGRKSHINDLSHVAAASSVAADSSFDAAYYAQQNPDVVAVYGTDPNSLYRHYVDHGRSEGRQSHMVYTAPASDSSSSSSSASAASYTAQQSSSSGRDAGRSGGHSSNRNGHE